MSSAPQVPAPAFPIAWPKTYECSASDKGVPSDEELMVRLQSNDTASLEILFDRYSRLLLTLARGILRDPGEAEDVVQDAFFCLYQKSRLFDGSKGSVKTWLLHIALHRALDHKAHLARSGFYTTDIPSLDDKLLDDTDLDREIGSKINRVQLEKAVRQLPELQRLTLELFYFEGLKLREISEKLHQHLGNTRHHFYRGLERLRKSAFVQSLRGRQC